MHRILSHHLLKFLKFGRFLGIVTANVTVEIYFRSMPPGKIVGGRCIALIKRTLFYYGLVIFPHNKAHIFKYCLYLYSKLFC